MGLKQFLCVLEPPSPLKLPEQSHMAKAGKIIQRKMDRFDAVDIAQLDIEQIAEELYALFGMNMLCDARPRNMRYAPYCLWAGSNPLAKEEAFLPELLALFRQKERRSHIAALIHAWLQNYDGKDQSFADAARFIREMLLSWPQWSWAGEERAFLFADSGDGPSKLSKQVLEAKGSIWAQLDELGLGADLAKAGFALATYREAIGLVRRQLEAGDLEDHGLARLLDWSGGSKNFNYPACKIELAEALLEPFVDRAPPKQLEEKIKSFLVENYGDPRLGGQGWGAGGAAHGWVGISDKAQAVIRRWLVKTSIDQFLHIVDETADVQEHWVYRKAFWKAYFKAEHISDAWVVFCREGERYAQRSRQTTGDESWLSFGTTKTTDSTHAALMMRIGDLVVVDWSHNGKCWIWHGSAAGTPPFYKRKYKWASLRLAPFGQVHHGSDHYTWQFKVAEHIRQHTGIEMTRADYQVKY